MISFIVIPLFTVVDWPTTGKPLAMIAAPCESPECVARQIPVPS